MTAFEELLKELRNLSNDNRERGDRFERLMVQYFKTDPLYKDKYNNIWMWRDFPLRDNKPDTGIDLVAQEKITGNYCAIQCKFFEPDHSIQKSDIDSFFTESGKSLYSDRIIISTTDKWSTNAENSLVDQSKPITRLRLADLEKSPIDWSKFSLSNPEKMVLLRKKALRKHQGQALDNVIKGFEEADRGQMIMACGTGKTFTSLKIAEKFVEINNGNHTKILYLVPSISLLSQTLREWNNDSEIPFNTFAVCSDRKVTKQSEDMTAVDVGFPATTNPELLLSNMKLAGEGKKMSVVFSTYQSIDVISQAQKMGLDEFDLIISDEAHRTTGVTLTGEDDSQFVRVHNQKFIQGKKRLYQSATPKIFSDDIKTKADDHNALLCSMDDEEIFGKVFHYLGFGEAVSRGLLTDYKVMVLAVNEDYVHSAFLNELKNEDNELQLSDVVKITGCWNGLSKRMSHSKETFGPPMKRAVAFSSSIKQSKLITDMFANIVDQLNDEEDGLRCEVEHVDGTFNALERNKKIDWLKEDTGKDNVCRILSNARCLTEGVDVPDLDAVMFLNPRNSVVDVVQAVGRVMRKADDKDYGYIILPIGIPSDMSPHEALNDNKKYKVVWQVLQALRAHDERFNTMVNQIELNKKKPKTVDIIGVPGGDPGQNGKGEGTTQITWNFPDLEDLKDAVYAKLVQKVGDRQYWENWASDVAQIAEIHFKRIKLLLEDPNAKHKKIFDEFLKEMQNNLNDGIDEDDAIEMLSQHMITKPVFDALFDEYSFIKNNPVSLAMEQMINVLEEQSLEKETQSLEKFYESVRNRARGIDNSEGKQKIIIELYDKFFKTAFPKTTNKLGIVYTPVEIVDFIINTANEALKSEFGVSLSDKNVHILDPFTGTGTFIVRLLQTGLIKPKDLVRKYIQELHANEIILLAYYIAAINIEEAYHGITKGEYQSFEGIVLTDTFQMTEGKKSLESELFPENNGRVIEQNSKNIQVIIGNPPYSVGQSSANDANQNTKYPDLEKSIEDTYAKNSNARLKRGLYDSYIKAFRWASNRIKDKGIVCFVSNGSYIDGGTMDGFRKSLMEEFTSVYCFNLRGNARTSGEQRRKEKGNVFGEGTRTPIAITLLIKNPYKIKESNIYYYDIGDYLTQQEKLEIISNFDNYKKIPWTPITPNEHSDWINNRDESFNSFLSLINKDKKEKVVYFKLNSNGLVTSRDPWTYNYSKNALKENVKKMITFYNNEVSRYQEYISSGNEEPKINDFLDHNPLKISWSRGLKNSVTSFKEIAFNERDIVVSSYRPFCKQWLYFNSDLIETQSKTAKLFPSPDLDNIIIYMSGAAASKDFSALITDCVPNFHFHDTGHGVPLKIFEKKEGNNLFDFESVENKYNSIDNTTVEILNLFKSKYSDRITKEDIFYYVYGVLHSSEYKYKYEVDLKKSIPRIPLLKDFWGFSEAGRKLADMHLNYELVEPYKVTELIQGGIDKIDYNVKKMVFGKNKDKTTIIYNNSITLTDIPLEAYDYQVNGKSAIEWIIEQYQVKTDKASQIKKDPNEWSENPRYVLDLLKRIITVSVETSRIVKSLPKLEEI